jgi:hypothetical protein
VVIPYLGIVAKLIFAELAAIIKLKLSYYETFSICYRDEKESDPGIHLSWPGHYHARINLVYSIAAGAYLIDPRHSNYSRLNLLQ